MIEIGSNKKAGWILFSVCAIVSIFCAYQFFAASSSFEYFCGIFTVLLGILMLIIIYSHKTIITLSDDRMVTGKGITIFWKEVKRVTIRTRLLFIPMGISIERKERSTIYISWINIDCGSSELAKYIVKKANEA